MWQEPDVNEGGTMLFIFAIIAAGMFINGAFKKSKSYGVLSIASVAGLTFLLVSYPNFQSLAIMCFAVFLLIGLALSFLGNLFQ